VSQLAWDRLTEHKNIRDIVNDKGLAKLGDSLVNLCYSLAKSMVLGDVTGEKVQDRVLARSIRAVPLYTQIGHKTDIGRAADAYEAIFAWLWLKRRVSIEAAVDIIVKALPIGPETGRKEEGQVASHAFQVLLEQTASQLPSDPLHIDMSPQNGSHPVSNP